MLSLLAGEIESVVLQVRVKEEHCFANPLPGRAFLEIIPRRPGPANTTFEQHLDRKQVCKLWDAFVRHNR